MGPGFVMISPFPDLQNIQRSYKYPLFLWAGEESGVCRHTAPCNVITLAWFLLCQLRVMAVRTTGSP